jgi:hypothetical protein
MVADVKSFLALEAGESPLTLKVPDTATRNRWTGG